MTQALAIGIRGHVGSQFNVAADLYNAIRRKFEAEGLTKTSQRELLALQTRGLELINAWKAGIRPDVNGFKYMANLAGVPVGDARLPSLPLDPASKKALHAAFRSFCAHGGKGLRMCA